MRNSKVSKDQTDFFPELESTPVTQPLPAAEPIVFKQESARQATLGLPLPKQRFNNHVAWGVRLGDLEKLNLQNLRNLFSGIYNVRIPISIARSLNPNEILAIYLSAGADKFKAYEKYSNRISTRNNPDDFASEESRKYLFRTCLNGVGYTNLSLSGIVKTANHNAYENRDFRFMACHIHSYFDRHEMERLADIPLEDEEVFVSSFQSIYLPLSSQEAGGRIPDPNLDGASKHVYAKRVYDRLRNDSSRIPFLGNPGKRKVAAYESNAPTKVSF